MYYSTDDSGHIILVSHDELPESQQAAIPDDAEPKVVEYEGNLIDFTSSSQPFVVQEVTNYMIPDDYVSVSDMQSLTDTIVSSEEFQEALQSVEERLAASQYPIYLSSNFVSVFDYVLDGLPVGTPYVIVQGSDSYTASMFYAEPFQYDVSGSSIVLHGPVTQCRLYRVQSGGSYSYNYYYQVSTTGDMTFSTGSNTLLYTNLVEGYPDLCPIDSGVSNYGFVILGTVLFLFLLVRLIFHRKE